MTATWVEFGRKEGETDEEWAAVCKEMAAFLRAQLDERHESADDAPKGDPA